MSELEVIELTAAGRGGVSVLAVQGEDALARVQELVPRRTLDPGALALVRLEVAGELLDEALVWAESERRVELHVHGSPPLVRRMRTELGGRPPRPTAAVALEERALQSVGAAPTEAGARILLDQAAGALRRALEELSRADGADLPRRAAALAEGGRVLGVLLSPPLVVLGGRVNAGKSTLFNALVGRERVVVHPERGTTRDAVRERVRLGAYAADVVDTAGEHAVRVGEAAAVEREGRALGRALRARADLVLWLHPRPVEALPRIVDGGQTCVLTSRADELPEAERSRAVHPVSARDAPEEARATVAACLHEALALPREPWSPGTPVPFEAPLVSLLGRLASGNLGRAEGRRALDSELAR